MACTSSPLCHARIEQRTGERGLWSGDLGLALYLRACIDGDDRWPLLDVLYKQDLSASRGS